jgi:hypothetical protein
MLCSRRYYELGDERHVTCCSIARSRYSITPTLTLISYSSIKNILLMTLHIQDVGIFDEKWRLADSSLISVYHTEGQRQGWFRKSVMLPRWNNSYEICCCTMFWVSRAWSHANVWFVGRNKPHVIIHSRHNKHGINDDLVLTFIPSNPSLA